MGWARLSWLETTPAEPLNAVVVQSEPLRFGEPAAKCLI